MRSSPALLPAVTVALTMGVCTGDGWAQERAAVANTVRPVPQLLQALRLDGRLEGTVTDELGTPLVGVAVSAHGAQLKFAVTDRQGRFVVDALPAGAYVVRAQSPGYAASRREMVQVQPARSTVQWFRLTRLGESRPVRPILAASMGGSAIGDAPDGTPGEEVDHEDSPTAWRLRHLKRSVLRDVQFQDAIGGEASPASADVASGPTDGFEIPWLGDLSLSGEFQFLTISSFDSPEELFTGTRVPHGVAYVTVSAPVGPQSTWAVQGALTDGEVSSWVLGGSYATTIAGRHATEFGSSYAAQRYDGGNQLALAAIGEASRAVGAIHAFDRWMLTPTMDLTAGTRFEYYSYLADAGLLSPSIEWRWAPSKAYAVRASASQQMLAPGAEEFVPSPVAGIWMPPHRTFSALDPSAGFQPQRTHHVEVGFERYLASFMFEARGFRQVVNDQIVTLFGLELPDRPRPDLGHYFTSTAGNVEAFGWGVGISRPVASRVRGSVRYTLTHANWLTVPRGTFLALARSVAEGKGERIHDLTTTLETAIPVTSTRVYAVYKLNTSFVNDSEGLDGVPGLDARFDVQVNQRVPLPFLPLGDAEWEVLVAVRNLFRDPLEGASVFDELLVVRPPKRIIGGLMLRF